MSKKKLVKIAVGALVGALLPIFIAFVAYPHLDWMLEETLNAGFFRVFVTLFGLLGAWMGAI